MKLNRNTTFSANQTRKSRRKGFTLIELLVSMTITLVIISVLMSMTRVAVNGMVSAQNATRYSRISQEVMSTVSKDLEGIVIRTGNDFEWVNVQENGNTSPNLGPDNNKEMQNPIEMSFFSAVTDRYDGNIGTADDKGGDISLVRYKLVYQDIITGGASGFPVFSLYRKRVDPDKAFTDHLSQTDLGSYSDQATGDEFLAENIYDITISFNFEFLRTDGTTAYKRIPVQINGEFKGLSIKGNEVLVTGSAGGPQELVVQNAGSARLSSADISLLVLSDAGMNGLDRTKIDSDEELSAYLLKHGKHFSKSVILPRP